MEPLPLRPPAAEEAPPEGRSTARDAAPTHRRLVLQLPMKAAVEATRGLAAHLCAHREHLAVATEATDVAVAGVVAADAVVADVSVADVLVADVKTEDVGSQVAHNGGGHATARGDPERLDAAQAPEL